MESENINMYVLSPENDENQRYLKMTDITTPITPTMTAISMGSEEKYPKMEYNKLSPNAVKANKDETLQIFSALMNSMQMTFTEGKNLHMN